MPAASSTLNILRSKSLPMAVYDEILRLILEGEFDAGEKLSEGHLAERLGVSRGPVREAFRALEEAGLVQLEKNRGVFVRKITHNEVEELYEVRAGLDEMVGRLLAPKITQTQLNELKTLIERMEKCLSQDNMAQYFPQNIFFHDRIVEMANNKKLIEVYRRVVNQMHLMRRQSIVGGGGNLLSNEEHRTIVEALATRDGNQAGRVMREHVMSGHRRLLGALDQEDQAPKLRGMRA